MLRKDEDKKYVKIHISLDPKLFEQLKQEIIKSGECRSELIRSALRNYLKSSSYKSKL
jgi:metal-responsive CopG/Arc/MetJ family transcriptional regulator